MKILKTALSLMMIAALLCLFGCGSETDSFLDDFESNVKAAEAMADSGEKASEEDIAKLKEMDADLQAKYKDFKGSEFSDDQKARLQELMKRALTARMKVLKSMQ